MNSGSDSRYLMENDDESRRLDLKTDVKTVKEQALWAGIKPGMRVLDVGCGIGKTTMALHDLVQPGGSAVGLDFSEERIAYAERVGRREGLQFIHRDLILPLEDLGTFDFIWNRFVLEYFRLEAWPIVQNMAKVLKHGGVICLIDLDYNCMSHFEMPQRLEKTLRELIETLETKGNFDPYVGRKLYAYLYRLGFVNTDVRVGAHHLIYGDLGPVDRYNWSRKMDVAGKKINFDFHRYELGYEEFMEEFMAFFSDPGRFTYTPLISVRGEKGSP